MCEEMSVENILPHYAETLDFKVMENDMQVRENDYLPVLHICFNQK